MSVFEAGKPYIAGRTAWPEGVENNLRAAGHELRMFFRSSISSTEEITMNTKRTVGARIVVLLMATAFSARGQQPPSTVMAGTKLRVQFTSEVGTAISRVNDGVEARLIKPLEAEGREVLPTGTILSGRVLAVRKGDKHRKSYPMIRLGFNRMTLPDGRSFPTQASLADLGVSVYVDSEGAASTKPVTKGDQVAVPVTTGAAGAGIGAIAGGGKGAAEGAAIGAGVGVLADLAGRAAQWYDFALKRGRKAWLRLDSDLVLTTTKVAASPKGQDSAKQ